VRDSITPTEELSAVLFTRLLLPFEVTSVLILIAILGAVSLARPGNGEPQGGAGPESGADPAGSAERTGGK
jgi:NADH-quinone oxidoreductase subunit J